MVKGTYAQEKRKEMLNLILNSIRTATIKNEKVNEFKLRAELALKYGVSDRKTKEYVDVLVNAELVERNAAGQLKATLEKEKN